MTGAIFAAEEPSSTNIDDLVAYTLGMVITPAADKVVSGVWWRFPDSLPAGTTTAAIWSTTGPTLLASKDYASPVAGIYNLATLDTPVTLTGGQSYVIGIRTGSRYVATTGRLDPDVTAGGFTASEGRFVENASLTYPTSTSQAWYGMDVEVSAAQSVAVGQAVETDTAGSITPSRTVPVGQATETDTAGTTTPSHTAAVGQAVETNTAGTVTPSHQVAVGPAQETDTAGAATPSKAVAVGQASETDTAGAVTPGRSVAVGQALETDTAQAITVTGGAERDLDIILGRPEPKWSIGRPVPKWTIGRVGG